MQVKKQINQFFPSIFIALSLAGFELAMILFVPTIDIDTMMNFDYEDLSKITQVVTIPFRILMLGLVIYAILFYKSNGTYSSKQVQLYQLLWMLWLLRFSYDIFIRTDLPITIGTKNFIFIVLSFVDIFVVKKIFAKIDWTITYRITLGLIITAIVGMLIKNPIFLLGADDVVGRIGGTTGLNPISTASIAACVPIMLLYSKSYLKTNMIGKVLFFMLILVSMVIILRASSRGPLISLAATIVLYRVFKSKNSGKGIATLVILCFSFFFLKDFIINIISDISPVLADRFDGKDESYYQREFMYNSAINNFLSNPIFGYAHGVLFQGKIGYPHNLVFEAFNALGLFGGVLTLYLMYAAFKASHDLIRRQSKIGWIGLLIMMQLIQGLFSGKFYGEERLTILWVLIFLCDLLSKRTKGENHSTYS